MNTLSMRSVMDFLGRVITVGVVYTGTLIVVNYGLPMQAQGDILTNERMLLLWTFIGSLLMALVIGLTAETIPATRTRHLGIWSSLLLGNAAAALLERAIYTSLTISEVIFLLLQQLLACVITADVIFYFFAPRGLPGHARAHHHWLGWLGRFAAAALASVVFYFAFSAINYSLISQPYYSSSLNNLIVPKPQTVLLVQLLRAPFVIFSLLPFLLTVHTLLPRLLVTSGLLLFIVGGIMPFLWQINQLPVDLLLASGLELLAQYFATGAMAAWLLGSFVTRHAHTPRLNHS